MATYWTGYIMNTDFSKVAEYVSGTLQGVEPDRIVSVTHSLATGVHHMGYSAMVVIRNEGS